MNLPKLLHELAARLGPATQRWAGASVVGAAIVLAACGGSDIDDPEFTLESADIPGGMLTMAQSANAPGFGCTSTNISPALAWRNAPAGTRSFVVTMYDPDAPTGSGFWHWTVFNIPAGTTSLATNAGTPSSGLAPAGSVQGRTDFGTSAYGGPCPPAGDRPHRYVFKVYALDIADLGLPATAPAALVSFVAKGAAIASASFTATYARAGAPVSFPEPPTIAGFTLSSGDVAEGARIGNEQVFNNFGCTGANISPALSWSGVPAGTKSLALVMYDPDAPTDSGFWHWTLFDIPPGTTGVVKNAGAVASLAPAGSKQGVVDYGSNGYGGPCPPVGDTPHRYLFTLYALGIDSLGVDATASGAVVGFVARNNAIAKAVLTANYGR